MLGPDRRPARAYFANLEAHPTNHRSRHSLHRLANRPPPAEVAGLLPAAPPACPVYAAALDAAAGLWAAWAAYGKRNMLLHGAGSLAALLDRLVAAAPGPVFVLRAHRRDASVNGLLEALSQHLLGAAPACRSPVRYAQELLHALGPASTIPIPITLAVHQIDAEPLRTEPAQEALALLARHPAFRLLCTAAHAAAPALWTPAQLAAFNFTFADATTLARFPEQELAAVIDGRQRGRAGAGATVQSCRLVLGTLPRAARQVYAILAEHQLRAAAPPAAPGAAEAADSSGSDDDDDGDGEEEDAAGSAETMARAGLAYHAWLLLCQQQLLVSSDAAFRTQLAEFLDHHVVVAVDDPAHAGHIYYLPFAAAEIRALLK